MKYCQFLAFLIDIHIEIFLLLNLQKQVVSYFFKNCFECNLLFYEEFVFGTASKVNCKVCCKTLITVRFFSHVFSRAVSQLCSLNGNSFCMKSHSFSKDVWDLTEWSLLIGWKEQSHDFRVRVCCFLLEKDTMPWCHLGETIETNFQSNFKPQTRQDTMGWKPWHHNTTRDSISSLISSHKPGKTPQSGNHDTMIPRGTAFLV